MKKKREEVTATPGGWKVEFDAQKILQELKDEGNKKPLEQRFASATNRALRKSLIRLMLREKLTSEKDHELFWLKCFVSSVPVPYFLGFHIAGGIPFNIQTFSFDAIAVLFIFSFPNLVYPKLEKHWKDRLFLPSVEIDRVIRGLAFAHLKGRSLVRLAAR